MFKSSGQGPKRDGGISLLRDSDLEAAKHLLSEVGGYGMFIVPVGEIEAWLSDLNIDRSKHTWLKQSLRAWDSLEDEGYIKLAKGDVWDLMDYIDWFSNSRRGILIRRR